MLPFDKYDRIQDQLKALSCMDELLSGKYFLTYIVLFNVLPLAGLHLGGGGGGRGEHCPARIKPTDHHNMNNSSNVKILRVFKVCYMYVYKYRRSGNFRVRKLSYDKFSCKNIFVGTTPYRISVNGAY